jgi:hypothetical protein
MKLTFKKRSSEELKKFFHKNFFIESLSSKSEEPIANSKSDSAPPPSPSNITIDNRKKK